MDAGKSIRILIEDRSMSRFSAGDVEITDDDAAFSGQDFCYFSFASSRKKFDAQLHHFIPHLGKVVQWGASQLNVECAISTVLPRWRRS
jgi:hypothetical protein